MTIAPSVTFTQREIERQIPCTIVGCDHTSCELTFVGRCHPRAAADVVYYKARGVLAIKCERCAKTIAEVAVAP